MSVWKKLVTAIKGGANDAAEAVVDHQAFRILEQEIREAKEELKRSDAALIGIIAKRKLAQQKVNGFNSGITEYEEHARKAMEKGQQELALECAQRVASLRNEQNVEQQFLDTFLSSEGTMKQKISEAKDRLRQLEQQIDVVKATEAVQKAQMTVASTNIGSNNKMYTAMDSLDRIKQRQVETAAKLEASQELDEESSSDSLDKKLAEAGISKNGSSAEDELARILGK